MQFGLKFEAWIGTKNSSQTRLRSFLIRNDGISAEIKSSSGRSGQI